MGNGDEKSLQLEQRKENKPFLPGLRFLQGKTSTKSLVQGENCHDKLIKQFTGDARINTSITQHLQVRLLQYRSEIIKVKEDLENNGDFLVHHRVNSKRVFTTTSQSFFFFTKRRRRNFSIFFFFFFPFASTTKTTAFP